MQALTFLEHRIRCGDSLAGVRDLNVLRQGIPDEAFTPVGGDEKTFANEVKKPNRSKRRDLTSGQLRLPFDLVALVSALGQEEAALDQIPDDSPELIRHKKQRYDRFLLEPKGEKLAQACDLWTAAFFQRIANGE